MATSPSTLEDLGIQGCLGLASLLLAQQRRLPVAPTRRMTLALMVPLRDAGVIDTPWPQSSWELDPTADETPIEHLQWRYTWSHYLRDGLLPVLEEFLDEVPRDDQGLAFRTQLWLDLGIADTERYFEGLLTRNRFDPAWAHDLGFVVRDLAVGLPLAQWRYCCWAAVRKGCSLTQQQPTLDGLRVRETIFAELKRRAAWVAAGSWQNYSFAPSNPVPDSAAARLFVTRLTRVGAKFWLTPTSWDALLELPEVPEVPATQPSAAIPEGDWAIAPEFVASE